MVQQTVIPKPRDKNGGTVRSSAEEFADEEERLNEGSGGNADASNTPDCGGEV
jgi:hypothetical protein